MEIVLIPGFWLDASSWDGVVGPLRQAGHTVHTPTLPGLESKDANREGIGLRDHVDAVVGSDRLHFRACRPRRAQWRRRHRPCGGRRQARPGCPGGLRRQRSPGRRWGHQRRIPRSRQRDPATGLVGIRRGRPRRSRRRVCEPSLRERAIPQPARVATDKQTLTDPRRYEVPVTVIACEFPSAMLREWMEQGHPYTAELAKIRSVELVDLPTGHWPQFTKPVEARRRHPGGRGELGTVELPIH